MAYKRQVTHRRSARRSAPASDRVPAGRHAFTHRSEAGRDQRRAVLVQQGRQTASRRNEGLNHQLTRPQRHAQPQAKRMAVAHPSLLRGPIIEQAAEESRSVVEDVPLHNLLRRWILLARHNMRHTRRPASGIPDDPSGKACKKASWMETDDQRAAVGAARTDAWIETV